MGDDMELSLEVEKLKNRLAQTRADLHQIPELAFQEWQTSTYIEERLQALGIAYEKGLAGTGIVAMIPGHTGTHTYCFRADMDALEIEEDNVIDHKSRHSGRMHACGHDGHMAVLLGLAELLVQGGYELADHVLLLFQPGEEGTGGASKIVETGILDQYHITELYGLHVFPGVRQGKLGIRPGPMMAQNSELDITVWGENAHGGTPHMGNDAIMIASQLILAFQTIISRNMNPLDPAVITFGRMYGGEIRNMIARRIDLEGTIRTFRPESYETIKSRLYQMLEGFEVTYQCQIDMDFRDLYPAVNNPPEMVDEWIRAQGKENVVLTDPIMLAEDFAFYQSRYPALFFFLGSRNEVKGYQHSLHHSCFDFDDDVLATGVQAFLNILIHKQAIDLTGKK